MKMPRDKRQPWQMTLEEYVPAINVLSNIDPDGSTENMGARILAKENAITDRSKWIHHETPERDDILVYEHDRIICAVDVETNNVVGMYQVYMPYVAPEYRGRGIIKEMHAVADELDRRFPASSYSESGIMARIGAHRLSFERALERGDAIPELVKAQYGLGAVPGSDSLVPAIRADVDWQKARYKVANRSDLPRPQMRSLRKSSDTEPAPKPLFTSCVDWPKLSSVDVLDEIRSNAEHVNIWTFEASVDPSSYKALKKHLGYHEDQPDTIQIEGDPAVKYCISDHGIPFLVHSGIEYVFAFNEDIQDIEREMELTREDHNTLVVVHPGSLCGSAIANVGRLEADGARSEILHQIADHRGSIVVIDCTLSDEIAPHENAAIEEAISRAQASGQAGFRIWGCDAGEPPYLDWKPRGISEGRAVFDSQEEAAKFILRHLPKAGIEVTGAWATPDHSSGCASSVFKTLEKAADVGLVTMSPTALEEPEFQPEDPDEPGSWDENYLEMR
jgi:GNAT superfamily N-acetyltransferase/sugar phosphate isomerase/epimerase